MSAAPAEVRDLSAVRGSTLPRIWTPPLVEGPPGPCGCGCALDRATSYGFAVDDFARHVLGEPLDPWQRWLAIHGGELLPDGRPRFRKVLTIVSRQSGKTHLLVVLTLYWLAVESQRMVLGTSTQIKYARESWQKAVAAVQRVPALTALQPPTRNRGIRQTNGEQELAVLADPDDPTTTCRYLIAAANEEGGRSLSLDRLILDELRQHRDYSAWDAVSPAMNARPAAQLWGITNQGDDRSVVLNDLRDEALRFIADGDGDRRLGLFEWSAPEGADPDDLDALIQAVPGLGYRQDPEALLADARAAIRAGGRKLVGFRTEILCQRVKNMDPAIDEARWVAAKDAGTLDGVRGRVALCLDVSLDEQHATLVAAAVLADGRVRVEPVRAWTGADCTTVLAAELPGLVARVKPRALGWFPNGPAASLATDLLAKRRGWPPRGVRVESIRNDTAAVCMGFAQDVMGGLVVHSGDPLLDAHVSSAEKATTGDRWTFTRKAGHVDAAYAAAGAAHLARMLPRASSPRIVVVE